MRLDAVDDEEIKGAVGQRQEELRISTSYQPLWRELGHEVGARGALQLEHGLVRVGRMHQHLGEGPT